MRPRDRAALILVAIALTWSCLAVGGAPRWAAVVGAALAVAAALPHLTSRRTSSKLTPMLVPLLVMVGLTAIQLLPLPIAIAEQIAPAKVALIRDNARAWGDAEPNWVLASYDPPATLVELAKLVGYLALAWSCVRLASDRACRRWLLTIAAGVATLVAAITLIHLALDLHLLYGVYRPSVQLPVLGPLVGVNHLASLLALVVPVAIALALRSTGFVRLGAGVAAGMLAGTALLTGSRGGAIGLGVGMIVLVTVLVVQRRAGTDEARKVPIALSLPAVATVVAAVVLLGVLTAGDVSRDLANTSLDEIHDPHNKFQIWVRATHLAADHRWLGVGKGAFAPAFMPRAETGSVSYSHAENGYLQALVDWGVPGAALLFLALGAAVVAGLQRWRNGPLEAGALAAIAALAVHDLADFSIELPAVAMMAIVIASTLFPARLATASKGAGASPESVRRRAAALAAAGALVALAASPLARSARADAARVMATPLARRIDLARHAAERHPADHVLAARAAEALLARGDRRAVKVIARALAMSSQSAGIRHLAGRILSRTDHPEQAAVEFAAATRWARDARPIVTDVLRVFRDPAQIAQSLATEPRQAGQIARALRDQGRPDAALRYLQRVVELHPLDGSMHALRAELALETRDWPTARSAAEAAWSLAATARHATLVGEALLASGETARGVELLTAAVARTGTDPAIERVRLLFTLAQLQVAAGAVADAKAVLERARDLSRDARDWRVMAHQRLAEVEDLLGNANQAAWERAEAARLGANP